MLNNFPLPVIGLVAPSGSGKTTLLEKLIPQLNHRGLRIAIIKASHHHFEVDEEGKDSRRLHRAGASQTLLISPSRRFWLMDTPDNGEPELSEALEHLQSADLDLVLVEGFKNAKMDKIGLHRSDSKHPLNLQEPLDYVAIVSDIPLTLSIPCLDLNREEDLTDFIMTRYFNE